MSPGYHPAFLLSKLDRDKEVFLSLAELHFGPGKGNPR